MYVDTIKSKIYTLHYLHTRIPKRINKLIPIENFKQNTSRILAPSQLARFSLVLRSILSQPYPHLLTNIKAIFALTLFCTAFSAHASNKVALIIGNSQYQHAEHLPIPANDAHAVSEQLQMLGFNTIEGIDVSKGEMKSLLRRFSKKLTPESIALFYYAGHGIQRDGKNYLIPINADIKKAYELEDAGLDFDIVLQAFNQTMPKLSIALIDACRDNPFEKRYTGATRGLKQRGAGLADVRESAGGTILSYATEPGKTAVDGYGDHSPYTAALLKYIKEPGLSVHDMLNKVGLEVLRATNNDQKPWVASSPVPHYCFAGCIDDPNRGYIPTISKPLSKDATIQLAIQKGDIASLSKLVIIKHRQYKFLKSLFSTYPSMSVNLSSTKRTRSAKNNKHKNKVSVTITEAINHKGNRVIPTKKWNSLTFTYRK